MDTILFTNEVCKLTHLTRQTLHRFAKEGTFPKPSKVARKNAWYKADIDQWLKSQMETGK